MLITKKQDARCMKPSDDCMKRTFTQKLLVYCSPCELIAYTKQKERKRGLDEETTLPLLLFLKCFAAAHK